MDNLVKKKQGKKCNQVFLKMVEIYKLETDFFIQKLEITLFNLIAFLAL